MSVPLDFFLFYRVFGCFSAMGVKKTQQKTFCKKIVSNSFYKKIDQKPRCCGSCCFHVCFAPSRPTSLVRRLAVPAGYAPRPCISGNDKRSDFFLFRKANFRFASHKGTSIRQNVTDWTGGQQPGFSSLSYVLKQFYRKKSGPRTPRPPFLGMLARSAEWLPSTRNWSFRWPLPLTSPPQVIPKAMRAASWPWWWFLGVGWHQRYGA